MQRTLAVHQVLVLLERLAPDAIPALVKALVYVARRRDATDELLHGRLVPRLRRPDEVVEGHVEELPRRAELLFHLVAIRERVESQLLRTLVDVLRVLVVAHDEERLDA